MSVFTGIFSIFTNNLILKGGRLFLKRNCGFEIINEIVTDAKNEEEFKKLFNAILLKVIMQIEYENHTRKLIKV